MKILPGILVMALIVAVLAVSAAIDLVIHAAPYLALAAAVFVLGRATTRQYRAGTSGPQAPLMPAPSGRPLAPPGSGWVLVPVWMEPVRDHQPPRFIDTEVIDERGGPS